MQNQYKKTIEDLLASAGIRINGNQDWDIRVFNDNFYRRLLSEGSLGLGESYMEGWWDCSRLDEFIHRLFQADLEKRIRKSLRLKWQVLKARIFNMQSLKKARISIARHYDIGNKLFSEMLDPLMVYSCGYWHETNDLAKAQENKLELICQKLKLRPGQKLLDIGCGWGGLPYYAAKNHGVEVVGITISLEQQKIAMERCQGLPVAIRLQDYREVNEKFDRIVSVGMLEHVGHKNHSSFMKIINRNMKDDGICLLHFIGSNETHHITDAWINKYIFP